MWCTIVLRHTGVMTEETLEQAAKAFWRAHRTAERRKDALFEEIRTAYKDPDIKTVTIERISGFSREHIRRIANAEDDS